jgi:hypothetical protein
MTAALATLSIDIVARLATLQQNLEAAGRLHAKHVQEVEARYARLKSIGTSLAASVGGSAVITQVAAFVDRTADAAVQVERLARISNAGNAEFQKFAFGAKSVGIEQDKLADILKDVNDKVGEFVQTGGGPLKEFFEKIAPRVGVTAAQFRRLSGPEALQLYVSSLQKANISQGETTFYMESLASDATALLPLLRDNGKEMLALGEKAEKLGRVLSTEALKSAREYRVAIDGMTDSLGALGQRIAISTMPGITKSIERLDQWIAKLQAADGLVSKLRFVGGEVAGFSLTGALRGSYQANFGESPGVVSAREQLRLIGVVQDLEARLRADAYGSPTLERDLDAARRRLSELRQSGAGLQGGRGSVFQEFVVPRPLGGVDDGVGGRGNKVPIRIPGQAIGDAFAGRLQDSLRNFRLDDKDFGFVVSAEEAFSRFNDRFSRLRELMASTPSAQRAALQSDIALIRDAYDQGLLGAINSTEAIERFSETVKARIGDLPEEIKPPLDGMSVAFEQFQRNVQDSLGTTVKATLKGDFDSILALWGDMLLQMAAQAIAADIGNYLFPKGGSGGVGSLISTVASLFGFAKGGAFQGGVPIKAFASGAVVASPTFFPLRGAMGLMGEAGPEAIMPLRRGRDGRLGVAASGGEARQVIYQYNVSAGINRNELMTALQLSASALRAEFHQTLRQSGVK